jgi:CrcB protein
MIGSLLVGVLAGALAAERLSLSPSMRALVFVGLIGGFTTFSALMLDSLTLFEAGVPLKALVNMFGQLAAGLLLIYGGYYIGLRS